MIMGKISNYIMLFIFNVGLILYPTNNTKTYSKNQNEIINNDTLIIKKDVLDICVEKSDEYRQNANRL